MHLQSTAVLIIGSVLPLQTPYMLSAGSQQQIVVANLTGGLTYEFKVISSYNIMISVSIIPTL